MHPEASLLTPETIHIWQIDLATLYGMDHLISFLNVHEQERATRFIFPHHQQRFIAAHYALRKILEYYLNIPAETIDFIHNAYGKPQVTLAQNDLQLEFNLSHSQDMALVGLRYAQPIGVDIECFSERDYLGIAKHSFSAQEYASLLPLPADQIAPAFFHIWTQKEAFIKAVGEGLSYSLKNFTVSTLPPADLLTVKEDDRLRWYLHSFTPKAAVAAAIATLNNFDHIAFFEFSNGT